MLSRKVADVVSVSITKLTTDFPYETEYRMSFPDLQNGLYNFTMQALGLTNASNFQLIQPGVTLPAGTSDATLWQWMNQIPPFALTASGSGGDQFFSDYESVMSSLTPSVAIDFAGDIGAAAGTAWGTYLATLPTPPNATQLPSLFFNWAFTHGYYSVADKGSSDLSAMLLEPIYRAQLALMPYTTVTGVSKGRAPEWSLGYAQLLSQLANAPKKSLSSANVQSNANVSGSWAASGSSGGFLLWGGASSSSSSSLSTTFASKAVSVSVSFDHVLSFVPVPGAWYDSAAFGLAYAAKTGSPWNSANTEVTWNKTFGPSGNMQRFTSALIVALGMQFTATSSSVFSAAEQATINQNSGSGFWPFYSSGSSSSVTTSHSFNSAGNLTIKTTTAANVPTLIGRIVLPAAQYLGYAVSGRNRYLQLSSVLKESVLTRN
jgi:hypothetical protein